MAVITWQFSLQNQVIDSMRHHPEILSNGGISSDQVKEAMSIADTVSTIYTTSP
jgi:hypothetical protein